MNSGGWEAGVEHLRRYVPSGGTDVTEWRSYPEQPGFWGSVLPREFQSAHAQPFDQTHQISLVPVPHSTRIALRVQVQLRIRGTISISRSRTVISTSSHIIINQTCHRPATSINSSTQLLFNHRSYSLLHFPTIFKFGVL